MNDPAVGVGFCANSGIATLHANNFKSCVKRPTTIENADVNDSAVGVGLCANSGIATLHAMPMVVGNDTTNCGEGDFA